MKTPLLHKKMLLIDFLFYFFVGQFFSPRNYYGKILVHYLKNQINANIGGITGG